MIIARYLCTKILFSTFAIASVLTLVILSSRLARYISAAAEGELAISLIFPVVLLRMPQLLEVILPLSLVLGILLSIGELYDKQEMTAIHSTGTSFNSIQRIVMSCGLFVALVVAIFSFYISPKGNHFVSNMFNTQGLSHELSIVTPQRFLNLKKNGGTLYVGEVDSERSTMRDIFIYRAEPIINGVQAGLNASPESNTENDGVTIPRETLVFAKNGFQQQRGNGEYYFVLEDGVQYEGAVGQNDYLVTEFERYSQRLPSKDSKLHRLASKEQNMSLVDLLNEPLTSETAAEISWRISLPVVVLIMAWIAVNLSRSKPRQNRFTMLMPAVLLFLLYIVLLNTAKEQLMHSSVSFFWNSLMWIHLLYFFLGLILATGSSVKSRLLQRRSLST